MSLILISSIFFSLILIYVYFYHSYHVPEVRIVTCEPLRPGKSSELLLKFCNPTQHQTQIILLSLDTPLTPILTAVDEKEELKQENTQQVNI